MRASGPVERGDPHPGPASATREGKVRVVKHTPPPARGERRTGMRFYTKSHRYYCGIDLHARRMYICILDADGQIRVHRNGPATPEHLLSTIAPYREDLVVAVECIFTWYWVADLCAREGLAFVLGHALYMKAIHGGKAKNDKIDAHKIAVLLRGGMLPMAYVYPRAMRSEEHRPRAVPHPHRQGTRCPHLLPAALRAGDRPNPGPRAPLRDPRHPPLPVRPGLRLLLPPREMRQGVRLLEGRRNLRR